MSGLRKSENKPPKAIREWLGLRCFIVAVNPCMTGSNAIRDADAWSNRHGCEPTYWQSLVKVA